VTKPEVITVTYDVGDAQGATVTQTATITVNGTNDAPLVEAALTAAADEDEAIFTVDLLAGASDVDAGAVLSVANVAGLVAGVTLSDSTLTVDPTDAAFQYLGVGDTEVITVTYDVGDAQGATVAQTATITVNGTNDAPKFSTSVSSVIAFADTIEASSGFEFSAGWGFQTYGTNSYGYPSVGQELHVNNVKSSSSGTAVLDIPGITTAGSYTVNVDVGNYNNIGLATILDVGLQSDGVFLAVTQSTIPSPASGHKETWVLTYEVTQAHVNAGLSFGIAVPATGVVANASFDNLIITTEVSSVDGDMVGSITELADNARGETTANLSTDGTFAFTDVDMTDTHTVSVAAKGAGYLGALTAVVSDDTTADGTGAVTWTFEINDGAVNYMAEGEALTQS
jgi:VCBS repeat-containing protein